MNKHVKALGHASLRDVQDYAGHKDPAPPPALPEHSRGSLDRNAAYTVAAYLA